MRKIAAALLGCLVLAGCASDWQADLRFKVTELEEKKGHPDQPGTMWVHLDLIGEMPEDALERKNFTGSGVPLDKVSGDVKVGDEVICTAKQKTMGAVQANSIETDLSGCKKA
ncbi:hypothetical protein G7043_24640 [Lentzea sp. NEAU-D13]|uniref:Lipoprotein n=1 Tax=Lentzea alba TaxID=2714351 RepID=A0A7C9RSY6_9PSEU|nr:hypothetical protein [Lentzea alba]NGY62124.1 hypothetical protein [Lentzea alba]